jgi:hypothetical protein
MAAHSFGFRLGDSGELIPPKQANPRDGRSAREPVFAYEFGVGFQHIAVPIEHATDRGGDVPVRAHSHSALAMARS